MSTESRWLLKIDAKVYLKIISEMHGRKHIVGYDGLSAVKMERVFFVRWSRAAEQSFLCLQK